MARAPTSRVLGELTFHDAARAIKDTSILCLPLGDDVPEGNLTYDPAFDETGESGGSSE